MAGGREPTRATILDVRPPAERLPKLDRNQSSLLESKGFVRLSNVMGGMQAIRHAERRAGFYGGVNCKPRNTSK
jgi:hypothetical protein